MKKFVLGIIIILAFLVRFYHLASVPLSLSWDEASLGYNAFAISQTMRDEHGEFMPLARFIAFGDYKPAGYIYTAVPFVKLLGLSELSTRLPSAIAGTLFVLVAYFLALELGRIIPFLYPYQRRQKFGWLAAFVVAISPWAVHFSHAAFESNLATFFSATGALFFLVAQRKKPLIFLLLSSLFFALATYTFNTHRIFVPLLLGGLTLIHFRSVLRNWKSSLVAYILLFLLVVPQLPFILSTEGKLRFNEVAWVNDLKPIEVSNERISRDDNNTFGKILHNRRVVYSLEFVSHYLDSVNPTFLFGTGDVNPRLSVQTVGELYLIELPFLLLGIFALGKHGGRGAKVLLLWALLAPIPGAFARETPHALRSLDILPVPQLVIALGIVYAWVQLSLSRVRKLRIVGAGLIALAFTLSFLLYIYEFFGNYPVATALEWQYGYKQMVEKVEEVENDYDSIIISETYGRPYIYFLFHESYDPTKYLKNRQVDRDWYGFWYVRKFGSYYFGSDEKKGTGRKLFVLGPNETISNTKIIDTITTPDGKPVFVLVEKK